MTAKEAYQILSKEYPAEAVRVCLDFGNFFLFSLVPFYIDSRETYYAGTIMDAVDKETGRIYKYDITDDVDAYLNARSIEIKTFLDQKI